jgi:hypothetical protein
MASSGMHKEIIIEKNNNNVWNVTIDGVRIGDRIYWTL